MQCAGAGLMSYGQNIADNLRRAATYVDKILKGAKVGELPVEQPTIFEFVVNLKTAKGLSLTIPQSLLLRADQASNDRLGRLSVPESGVHMTPNHSLNRTARRRRCAPPARRRLAWFVSRRSLDTKA